MRALSIAAPCPDPAPTRSCRLAGDSPLPGVVRARGAVRRGDAARRRAEPRRARRRRCPTACRPSAAGRALEIAGPLDLALTGVTARLATALAAADVSIVPAGHLRHRRDPRPRRAASTTRSPRCAQTGTMCRDERCRRPHRHPRPRPHGSGEPLLLLHGFGSRRQRVGRGPAAARAHKRDVITVDLPGFGESPPTVEHPTPPRLAEAVERFMDDARARARARRRAGRWAGGSRSS